MDMRWRWNLVMGSVIWMAWPLCGVGAAPPSTPAATTAPVAASASDAAAATPPSEATTAPAAAGTLPGGKAAETSQVPPAAAADAPAASTPAAAVPDDRTKLVRLDPQAEVWVDAKQHRVIVGGTICLRQGQLEMFACPRGTKEHESIVAVNGAAYLVHTALLAIGARNVHPVQYEPTYRAAEGSAIKVEVIWRNDAGKVERTDARQWVRRISDKQPLNSNWVFAGSNFWQDEKTGERFYQAEGGELICLSNFSTATLDLPVESPRDNADLLFEAWTERIPPLGTSVRLVLSIAKTP